MPAKPQTPKQRRARARTWQLCRLKSLNPQSVIDSLLAAGYTGPELSTVNIYTNARDLQFALNRMHASINELSIS
jgi:hypothetical protein